MSKYRSKHYQRVHDFISKVEEANPDAPAVPNAPRIPTGLLRISLARLVLEEALETITAMGVTVKADCHGINYDGIPLCDPHLKYSAGPDYEVDIIEVIDGCCDTHVVVNNILVRFGVDDKLYQQEVDRTNLEKFQGDAHLDENHKWVKPSDWKPPRILALLEEECDRKGCHVRYVIAGTQVGDWPAPVSGWIWYDELGCANQAIYPTFAKAYTALVRYTESLDDIETPVGGEVLQPQVLNPSDTVKGQVEL